MKQKAQLTLGCSLCPAANNRDEFMVDEQSRQGLALQEFRRKQSPLRLLGDMLSGPFLLFREKVFLEADFMCGVLCSQMNI